MWFSLNSRTKLWMAGAIGAFAWPPYHLVPAFFLSFTALMVQLWECPSYQEGARCGWWWAFGMHGLSLFWVGHSLWIDPWRFAWLWPLSVVGLPALLALYGALGGALMVLLKRQRHLCPLTYGLCFAGLWSGLEFCQGHLLTGFPWNLAAYIWAPFPCMTQSVAYLGSYGMGLVTFLLASAMGICFLQKGHGFRGGLVSALVIGGLALLGHWRLQSGAVDDHKDFVLRLVQPSFPQHENIDPTYGASHFSRLVELSRLNAKDKAPTHVIWSEGVLPWGFTPQTLSHFPFLSSSFTLLTGGLYGTTTHLFNSLMLKPPFLPLKPLYAKRHLLPFGEYIPFRTVFSRFVPAAWLKKVTPGTTDFSAGPRESDVITETSLPPFRCLICYEAIFPGTIRSTHSGPEPQWILNITNDGWFGKSPGPYQHFVSARFRAIEEGLPLVRVANTGISALIDPWGRVLASLPLGHSGVCDVALPKAIARPLASWYGDKIWGSAMIFLFLFVLLRKSSFSRSLKSIYSKKML